MTKGTRPDDVPPPPFPDGKFACIAADMPWHFESRAPSANPTSVRSPQRHYPTMSLEAMEALPVRQLAAPDCFLFMWMTGPGLVLGWHLRLFKAWGFRPSSMGFVWIKTLAKLDMSTLERSPLLESDLHMGGGFTTRQNAEYVVIGRRGSPSRLRADVRQVIIEPVREHSRKPEKFFRLAEAFCVGPRIDLFAGAEREGWTSWGIPHRAGERDAA